MIPPSLWFDGSEGENRMLKVLIADDEQLISAMIRKMIRWNEKGMEVAGTADNGLEILRMTEELRPDIVITDIRMPGIDGLEMIRRAMEVSPDTEFIIISGYKNFEYAHQALNMGVRHYLLKPIDQTELSDTLDRILEEKAKNRISGEEEKLLHETLESRQSMRRHFLNSILKKTELAPEEDGEEPGEQELSFSNSLYRAFLVKIDSTESGEIPTSLLEMLLAVVEDAERGWECDYINTLAKNGIVSVVNYPREGEGLSREKTEALYTRCRKELDKFSGYSVTVGIGTEKDDISRVRETIEEAIGAVKLRILRGIDRVIPYEAPDAEAPGAEALLTEELRRGIVRAIEARDADAVVSDYRLLMETPGHRRTADGIFSLTDAYTKMIRDAWRRSGTDETLVSEFLLAVETVLDRSTTEARLIQAFEETVQEYFRRVIESERQKGQAPVRLAKQYLSEHFAEGPALEEVARHVGMSPAYFSTVFKKEFGIGFSEYLIQLRIEESKRLMRETALPIGEISERVGYADTKYFSRIFRKSVGLKPSEYRKIYR